jgi:ubiquinone/menaquinone biosynthesis C-methylase UbiE
VSPHDVAAAYDAIAATYDSAVAGDAGIRQRLWTHYLARFRSGDRVLDLFCGTGIDATFLACRGVHVIGLDASPGMLAECRRKVATLGIDQLVEMRLGDVSDLTRLPPNHLDGAVTAFGGLNAVADLREVSLGLARTLRPGGHFVAHVVNRFSLWEALGYVTSGRLASVWRMSRKSSREFQIGGKSVRHYLYGPDETYHRFFKPEFHLCQVFGLGIVQPPPTLQRFPPVARAASGRVERAIESWPIVRAMGRWFVVDLERR